MLIRIYKFEKIINIAPKRRKSIIFFFFNIGLLLIAVTCGVKLKPIEIHAIVIKSIAVILFNRRDVYQFKYY